ncbi:MAG TPA: hypothetical protein VMQ50_06805 [Casimicrobiaceae bacterium]|nr:hypothetical protein [Casimicrobiaceae bacterium]
MRAFLTRLRDIVATMLACAVVTLPSCASMGGGGMKGMFAEPAASSTASVSL